MRRIVGRSCACRPSNRFSLDRTFPDGVLVRSSSGKSIAFSALVPIHPGCCLFVSFEVRFETKRE